MSKKILRVPVSPGELLLEEFMKPLVISQYKLAKDTGLAPICISEIIRGKRSITANTALRFAKYFGTSAQFWLNMQSGYDLRLAERKLADVLETEVKVLDMKKLKPKFGV